MGILAVLVVLLCTKYCCTRENEPVLYFQWMPNKTNILFALAQQLPIVCCVYLSKHVYGVDGMSANSAVKLYLFLSIMNWKSKLKIYGRDCVVVQISQSNPSV